MRFPRRLIKDATEKIVPFIEPSKDITKLIPQRLPPLLTVRQLIRLYKIRAKQNLSQNFLMNQRICDKIGKYSKIKPGDTVVEIGPGPGNITRTILQKAPREVFLIEKDRRFLPVLEMLADAAYPGQVKIIIGDILNYSLSKMFPSELIRTWDDQVPNIRFLGNLPFNISIPLLIKWLQQIHERTGPFEYGRVPLILTFQLEVAQRICAPVMNYNRSRISVMAQLFTHPKRCLNIKGSAFFPKPKVDVSLIRFTPLKKSLIDTSIPFNVIQKFVRVFFHIRRGYSINCVKKLFPPNMKELAMIIFEKSNVSPKDISVMISNEELAKMISIYWKICEEHPEIVDYDFQTCKKEPKIFKQLFLQKKELPLLEKKKEKIFLDDNITK